MNTITVVEDKDYDDKYVATFKRLDKVDYIVNVGGAKLEAKGGCFFGTFDIDELTPEEVALKVATKVLTREGFAVT